MGSKCTIVQAQNVLWPWPTFGSVTYFLRKIRFLAITRSIFIRSGWSWAQNVGFVVAQIFLIYMWPLKLKGQGHLPFGRFCAYIAMVYGHSWNIYNTWYAQRNSTIHNVRLQKEHTSRDRDLLLGPWPTFSRKSFFGHNSANFYPILLILGSNFRICKGTDFCNLHVTSKVERSRSFGHRKVLWDNTLT